MKNLIRKTLARLGFDIRQVSEQGNKINYLENQVVLLNRQVEHLTKKEKIYRDMIFLHRECLSRAVEKEEVSYEAPKMKKNLFDLEQSYSQLRQLAPAVFREWTILQKNGEDEYTNNREGSCSDAGCQGAEAFRAFISIYINGNVLDIGCGPGEVPTYLKEYPVNHLYGIDPLLEDSDQSLRFMKNIAEFLPWDDDSFSSVIVATSLDHVLLLDKALAEMKRVLKPTGMLLIWTRLVEGSPKYDPYASEIVPADRFHLFRLNKDWFEEMMDEVGFVKQDYFEESYGAFYAFRHKESLQSASHCAVSTDAL